MSTPRPLLIVTLLFRSKPEFDQLTHVVDATSAYLDSCVELGLAEACAFNSVTLLERIWQNRSPERMESNPIEFQRAVVTTVKKRGLSMISWLFDHFPGCVVPTEAIQLVAGDGNVEILQYFSDHGVPFDAVAAIIVGGGMSPDMVNFLLEQDFSEDSMDQNSEMDAVVDGVMSSEILDRCERDIPRSLGIRENVRGAEVNKRSSAKVRVNWAGDEIVYAARNQHFDTVKWLYHNAPTFHRIDKAIETAAMNGDDAMLEWLRSHYQYGI